MTGLFVSLRILGQFYNFRAILQVQAPKGLIFGLTDVFFSHYQLGGLILFWKGLYMEGLIFEILPCVFPASAKNTSETTLPIWQDR